MLLSATEASKQQFYSWISKKLMDFSTIRKAYWSLLKTFLNNKKISCIPTLFQDNKFIRNFRDKAELFHKIFAKQCTWINNGSETPKRVNLKATKTL